jgi:hypothetical protein
VRRNTPSNILAKKKKAKVICREVVHKAKCEWGLTSSSTPSRSRTSNGSDRVGCAQSADVAPAACVWELRRRRCLRPTPDGRVQRWRSIAVAVLRQRCHW